MHVGDYTLEDTVTIPFTTRAFATGIPTALVSGAVEIYEDSGTTQITAAETLTASFDSVTGFNMLSIAATAANGFENGKSYTAVLSAGTVDSVSVVGEVVGHFTIGRSAAAVDLANGTDGLGALKTDTAAILVDTGTTLPASLAAIDGNVDAILVDTGTTLQAELDAIQAAVITNAAGVDIAADIIALKAVADAVLVDTAEIGAAGAGLTEAGGTGDHLTAINLPDQTMNITGNITGNLSGSVGSVTGAVGSVTARVDANITHVNETVVAGTGASGDEWGPA